MPPPGQFATLAAIPRLRHAITNRLGGQSSGPYASLNLGFHVGDDANDVRANRGSAAGSLGYDAEALVAAQQVHGDAAQRVTLQDAGRGALDWESALPATDAIYTGESQLPLLILVADCAPLLLVDESSLTLAVVHAGWRGALAGIGGKTVTAMGGESAEVRTGIGPCLCVACLEIGPEVADQVGAVDAAAVVDGYSKPHLDLRGLIRRDLVKAGVPAPNIEISDVCPRCQRATYFSHRGDDGTTGRFGLVAWWE